ncbi:hypothetical protein BT63DRAFT_467179 [Microthyrium microscopicum]|uniref:Aminoglycoside phosphotransferase domain-containing protein n=1 Tax=Microthyrium microscopicum TaxID=703497 RepID=A0A6A6UQB7_9PEZI|nr:hypothetical protein BT63DRAFT_467179 [Microthyrium microscopicum]
MDDRSDFYQYTSGRWLRVPVFYNETLRQKERFLAFNVLGLQDIAAKAIGKSASDVVSFRKLAEGGFNRIFVIGMNDGREVIARLPCSIALPSRLTVASEAATIMFLRSHGVPVPEVLDYSTTTENAAGVEYIIMEKAAGEELGDRWFSLPDLDRAKLVGRLSQIESLLFSIPLPASGSIFYKKDLDSAIPSLQISNTEFYVGPSVEQRWWHDQRGELNVSRGPFRTAEDFLTAGAEKELAWLRKFGEPSFPPREYREFTNYQQSDPAEQIGSLQQFLQIARHLIPTNPEQQYLLKPTLRHPDLNPRNIFVGADLKISSLIDWQHCSAVPLFLQAGVPNTFANFGDEDSVQLKKPVLAQNLSNMSAQDQAQAIELYRRQHLHFYYFGGASKFNNVHYKALRLPSTALKQRLCFNASSPWQGNPIPLKAALILATQNWDTLTAESTETASNCPISFTDEEAARILRINAAQDDVDEKISLLRDGIGSGEDGWVPIENYDRAVAENQRLKEELLKDVSNEERRLSLQHWPFDEHILDC